MLNFVLGITNFNRLPYLKKLIESWEKTKSNNNWKLIIADDGSDKDTLEYFDFLYNKDKDYILKIIRLKNVGVANLTNVIFNELEDDDFDFCFRADNDIYFKKTGWDLKYYNTAKKTGFFHLVYNRNNHDEKDLWDKEKNRGLKFPECPKAFGCFFTLNKNILKDIGYFDIDNLGPIFFGHRDFSYRCALAGYNDLYKMWDIGGSNQYIEMQGQDGEKYICSLEKQKKNKWRYQGKKNIQTIFEETYNKKRGLYINFNNHNL